MIGLEHEVLERITDRGRTGRPGVRGHRLYHQTLGSVDVTRIEAAEPPAPTAPRDRRDRRRGLDRSRARTRGGRRAARSSSRGKPFVIRWRRSNGPASSGETQRAVVQASRQVGGLRHRHATVSDIVLAAPPDVFQVQYDQFAMGGEDHPDPASGALGDGGEECRQVAVLEPTMLVEQDVSVVDHRQDGGVRQHRERLVQFGLPPIGRLQTVRDGRRRRVPRGADEPGGCRE